MDHRLECVEELCLGHLSNFMTSDEMPLTAAAKPAMVAPGNFTRIGERINATP